VLGERLGDVSGGKGVGTGGTEGIDDRKRCSRSLSSRRIQAPGAMVRKSEQAEGGSETKGKEMVSVKKKKRGGGHPEPCLQRLSRPRRNGKEAAGKREGARKGTTSFESHKCDRKAWPDGEGGGTLGEGPQKKSLGKE